MIQSNSFFTHNNICINSNSVLHHLQYYRYTLTKVLIFFVCTFLTKVFVENPLFFFFSPVSISHHSSLFIFAIYFGSFLFFHSCFFSLIRHPISNYLFICPSCHILASFSFPLLQRFFLLSLTTCHGKYVVMITKQEESRYLLLILFMGEGKYIQPFAF